MSAVDGGLREELFLPDGVVYLDNAATAPRFRRAVERAARFYQSENASIHRGAYPLSLRATQAYEEARASVAAFLNAACEREIVFTKNATEAANLLAFCLEDVLQSGGAVAVTALEHHANYLPWQRLCRRTGREFRVIPVQADGRLDMEAAARILDRDVRLVCVSAMSNVTGEQPDLPALRRMAVQAGALMAVDAAQAAAHRQIDVQRLGCDFLFLSAHKLGGPMGVGVLYGRLALLESLPPFLVGGGMVESAVSETPRWKRVPWKLEAGTPDVAGALGFAEALACWKRLGPQRLFEKERASARALRRELASIDGLHTVGGGEDSPLIALASDLFSPYDMGVLLAGAGICARCGSHCAQPYIEQLGLRGVCRLSLSFFHTQEELARTARVLKDLHERGKRRGMA